MLDISNIDLDTFILDLEEVSGISDLISLGYYKIKWYIAAKSEQLLQI